MESVGDYLELVQGEQGREFVLVILKLLPGVPDVGVLVGGVLELDDAEGQPVQEQDDIGPSGGLVLPHGELVDGEPVVVVGVLEVDDAGRHSGHGAVGLSDRDGDSPG